MKVNGISNINRNAGVVLHNKSPKFKGTPLYMNITCDGIKDYNNLANGSYLDIHDDSFAPGNKKIRSYNLFFLSFIMEDKDKKEFIEHFKSITKFPDLNAVSENIENEFINSVKAVSKGFRDYKYDVIAAGYDQTCSVGKGFALPGSDLDKAFIILRGDESKIYDKNKDEEIVNKFKSRLWNSTDQRILSYNHDTSFPTVMTVNQIKSYISQINNVLNGIQYDESKFSDNVEREYLDLIKASEFNLMLAEKLPKRKYDDEAHTLNKENVKNFAYFIESLREGKRVIISKELDDLIKSIEGSDFYKYSNLAQMKAMKNAVNSGQEQKSKIILRQNLNNDFEKWSLDKQFDFVRTLILYSCESQNDFNEYFKNDRDIKENYKPLLGLLCYGDKDRRVNPVFEFFDEKINIYLSENKPVSLYKGADEKILWIDSTSVSDIEDILLQVHKLKKINMFSKIDRVQAPMPDLFHIKGIDKFYKLNAYTSVGKQIIERML